MQHESPLTTIFPLIRPAIRALVSQGGVPSDFHETPPRVCVDPRRTCIFSRWVVVWQKTVIFRLKVERSRTKQIEEKMQGYHGIFHIVKSPIWCDIRLDGSSQSTCQWMGSSTHLSLLETLLSGVSLSILIKRIEHIFIFDWLVRTTPNRLPICSSFSWGK